MPTKEFNNVQLDVTFIQAATRSNITSGEDIATSFGKISKWFTDLKSIAWDGHPTVTQKDTTSTISPNHEETFTVVDSVTRNGEGHVTGINVKTVKLPTGSGYVHPSHDSHTSGLYKITVDELGHVSDATAVTKADITDLGIPGSDTNTTYTLSGSYGSDDNTWITTLTPSSGSPTTSTVPTASTTAYGITKLSSATNSTSTSLAATASAVKAAYDKANHSHPYLPLAGGTMTGKITCVGGLYTDDYTTGCIDCKNSNIVGLNSLVFSDLADTAGEGLQFYRTSTNVDTLWVKNGVIYFSPNRPLGTTSDITTHTVIHSGNLTSYTYSSTTSRTANTVLAAPNGSAGAATFRTLVTADLPASGATAGSYGPSANASPAHSGTFSVPYITINAKGQVTAASTKTITLPASGNTDTKVNVTLGTTTKAYLLGTSTTPTSTATGVTAIADTGVYLDTTAGKLTATTFAGALSGNASSATKWATARNINGLSVDGTANRVNYGTCSTAAATAAKVVACTGFALVTGAEITVKFTVTNTAASPTLNVNSTGAIAIYYRGSAISAGYLAADRTYTFRYNGTNYDLVGDINTNTNTYVTQSATTTANYRAILMGFNNSTDASTLTTTVTNQAYASSSIYAQPSTGTLYASKYNGYKVEGTSGKWFSSIPVIRNDGVMEAGKYIDFHTTNTGTTDYDVRLTAGSGTLTCSGILQNTTYTKLLYSGTGSTAITINGLSSSTWDTFTVVVMDGGSGYTHNIRANKGEYTRYCVPTTPGYNTASTSTGLLSIGVAINMKTNTVEVASSKYIITASSTTPSANTHSRNFTIEKVYGHKYYYS